MNQLLRLLVGICLRRLGPQDLPYSIPLLRGLVLVAVGLQVLFSLLLRGEVAVHRLLLGVVLTLGLPWLVLQWRQRRARYVQTLTALVGTGILFAIAMAPLLWLSVDMPPPSEGTPPTPRQAFVSIAAICLVAWKIAVDGHIWRHALGWPLAGGVLLALGLFLLELGIEQVLFPVALQ
ncbi:hypothetical protein [Chiayiivirga flava]|uniref:Uncharacterized protein n=1 Tax=Chiayiivirga flava TaxID=659595 RepID=A0A7W8D4U6_9GAMM|nr:hypothetical protein [Chiayiivirga flava]MBB5207567.1 hypothetical protein [Chiayiivirga flava]